MGTNGIAIATLMTSTGLDKAAGDGDGAAGAVLSGSDASSQIVAEGNHVSAGNGYVARVAVFATS